MIKRQEQVVSLLEAMIKNNAKVFVRVFLFFLILIVAVSIKCCSKQNANGQRFIALTSDTDLVLEPISQSLLVDSPAYTSVQGHLV